ncbi:MAG: hypothetical protein J6P07_06775 [Spirochaetaceae bacterium]|nr:hypothetical protein [Spirochaetaceae bacterium]
MGQLAEFTQSLMTASNTLAGIASDIGHEEAALATQTKQIQLQTDINAELEKIRNSANDEEWQAQVDNFFTRVKSGMSDQNSPYYCKNNLQAKQFMGILEQNRVGVSAKVGIMAEQRQMQKDIINVQNAKKQLSQMYFGQEYINKANELDEKLYRTGRLSPEQYQQQKDLNFQNGYIESRIKTFEASLNDAISQGKSFEALYDDVQSVMPEMTHTDVNGLEIAFDKTKLDEQIKKTMQQTYNAKLRDIQDGNANRLSEIAQQMYQQTTEEGRLAAARKGQRAMNGMLGKQLSEQDRLSYAKLFDIFANTKKSGSGSGSGGSSNDLEKYSDFFKESPKLGVQLVIDGKLPNYYAGADAISKTMYDELMFGEWKENHNKSYEERDKMWGTEYYGKAGKESMLNEMYDRVIKMRPALETFFNTKVNSLISDIKNNRDNYDEKTLIQFTNLWRDTVLGSNANESDEELVERFNKSYNDIVVGGLNYMEFNKKGNLKKTFNANTPEGIAQAMKYAGENDVLYTYNGETLGRKEELEAKGGIVDVAKTAVVSTLGIPQEDIESGKVGFYYKPDKLHDDVTSTPIITYNNKAYDVIPTEDGKNFNLKEVHTGEVIEGKTAKEYRKEAKLAAKQNVKTAAAETKAIENERAEYIREKASKVDTIPKAVVGAGSTTATDWQASSATRQSFLQNAAKKIDNAAKRVKTDQDKKEFKETYGIDYAEWVKIKGQTDKYELILNS